MPAQQPSMRSERHFGNRVVTCFAERPANVHALLADAVAAHPDRDALICGETRLTYAAFDAEVARLAGGLAAKGVGKGDRVALLLGNGIPFVALTYAIARLGAIMVPLSIRDQMPGLRHALTDSGAMLLVAEAEVAAIVPPAAETPALLHRISIGRSKSFTGYDSLQSAGTVTKAAGLDEDETAAILYTSGTTGRPKGAMLTGLGIVHSAMNYQHAMQLGPDDRTIIVVPMSHVTGLLAGIHTTIRSGGAIVVEREFDAIRFLELAARERMSFTVMVPAMYNLCLHRAKLSDYDLSAWKIGGYGGAPMPEPTISRLAEELPRLGLMNCYGATETTSPVSTMPPEHTAARRLSVGMPTLGAEILVMDDDGREVGPGEHGELWHRGAMVVPGYWENREATAREFVAGFWKSGDIGSKDADGFVYVHDRKKDMINRGGYKIYTAEVESVLLAAPGIREAAVIAKPCPILGERVHAVITVETDAAADEEALATICAAGLADYKRPESFTVRTHPLPRNANGKIVKRQIREELGFVSKG
jgi:acyl-CoA synthetase (AMP-forming)/AMP-acid ligase II